MYTFILYREEVQRIVVQSLRVKKKVLMRSMMAVSLQGGELMAILDKVKIMEESERKTSMSVY